MQTTLKKKKIYKGSAREKFIECFGQSIEEYESIQRAIKTLREATVENYLRKLPAFFIYINESPDQVISNRQKDLSSPDAFTVERYDRLVKEYINILVKQDKVTIDFLSCIQGFFVNNGKRLKLDLGRMKLPKHRKRRKYSPTNEEMRRLFGFADSALKRLIIILGYQHGLAPIDIASIKVGDYPEEPWQYFEFSRSKTGVICRCVSTPDGCRALKDYMLLRKGVAKEPLLLGARGAPVNNQEIGNIVHDLVIKAGLDGIEGFSAKCLRDGLEDAMVDVEIYPKTKEAFMGHTSDISHVYGSQRKMEERMVEAMRKMYPLICLTSNDNTGGVLESDAMLRLAQLEEEMKLMRALLQSGDIVNVNDPQLKYKLKAKGVL